MSEKKIVVPEGMLKAACVHIDVSSYGGYEQLQAVKSCLPLALRWLSENPIVPTNEQAAALLAVKPDIPETVTPYTVIVCTEWQRCMFDAPEPEVLAGFMECSACRVKPGSPTLCDGCLHNRAVIERLSGNITEGRSGVPEPGVPEEIADILFSASHPGTRLHLSPHWINEQMIECFRRGQKAG